MFTPRKIEERQLTVKRLLEDTASNMCTSLADESLLEGLTGIEKRKLMKQHGLRKDFFECSDNRMLKEIIEKNLNIEIEFMSL